MLKKINRLVRFTSIQTKQLLPSFVALFACISIYSNTAMASDDENTEESTESEVVYKDIKTIKTEKKTHLSEISANSDKKQRTLPIKGINQEQVLSEFGEPSKKSQPRGTPPISSWTYPQFTVYFESGIVIHTVTF